jgi:hypothetical protein
VNGGKHSRISSLNIFVNAPVCHTERWICPFPAMKSVARPHTSSATVLQGFTVVLSRVLSHRYPVVFQEGLTWPTSQT